MNPFKSGSKPAPAETPFSGNEAVEAISHRRNYLLHCVEAVRQLEIKSRTAGMALHEARVPGAGQVNPLFNVQKVMENSFVPKADAYPAGVQATPNPVEWQPQPYVPADAPLVETPAPQAAQPVAPPAPAELAEPDPMTRLHQIIDSEAVSRDDYQLEEAA